MSIDQAEVSGGRREQLLAAAREVLAENGYERTTVSSIATRANVAQGTFYLYFPSKEALPGALAMELSRALGAATARWSPRTSTSRPRSRRCKRPCRRRRSSFADVLPIANRGYELAERFEDWLALTEPWRVAARGVPDAAAGHAARSSRRSTSSTTAYVMRDLLDRTMKARVLFGETGYAEAIATLVRRALSTD